MVEKLLPSQETENTAFLNAEKFALEISSNGKNFYDVANDNSYQSKPAVGLRIMDERIPGILRNTKTNSDLGFWQ